ncbi:WD40 repeat domain-containing protein [Asticcacaulis sp.]|uniref:WD40 repeat domain-containing protein n=1 Tax=Asticcacaulis sp. TaxID=1872648 RepID=UPI0026221BC0|nr:WD40 repeat domain-containing protein [Asticcacaulis sp.]
MKMASNWQEECRVVATSCTESYEHMVLSPNGQFLLSWNKYLSGAAALWDITKDKIITASINGGIVVGVSWAPDSKRMVISNNAHGNSTLSVWTVAEDGTFVKQNEIVQQGIWATDVAWSPTSDFILLGRAFGEIEMWSVAEDGALTKKSQVSKGYPERFYATVWAPNGKHMVSASTFGKLRVWSVAENGSLVEQESQVLQGCHEWYNKVAWSPDGKQILHADHDQTLAIWAMNENGLFTKAMELRRSVPNVAKHIEWSPDGKYIGIFGKNREIFDARSGKLLFCGKESWTGVFLNSHQILTPGFKTTICPWSDKTHMYFSPAFRSLVFHLMCCKHRLDLNENCSLVLPRLGMSLWLDIFLALVNLN